MRGSWESILYVYGRAGEASLFGDARQKNTNGRMRRRRGESLCRTGLSITREERGRERERLLFNGGSAA